MVVAVLFLVAVVVQYNDPDPLLWMAVYGGAAVLSALYAWGRFPRPVGAIYAVSCLLGALVLAPGVLGKHSLVGSEPGHEMLGLFLIALWIGSLVIGAYRHTG